MKRKIVAATAAALLSLASTLNAAQQAPTYDSLLKTANEAFEAGDWQAVATALDTAQPFRPYSEFIMRNRVLAYSMLGEFEHAQSIVAKVANRGLSMRLAGHPGFEGAYFAYGVYTFARSNGGQS